MLREYEDARVDHEHWIAGEGDNDTLEEKSEADLNMVLEA